MPWAVAGAIGGALISSSAAGDAADQQSESAAQGRQLSQQQFEQTRQDQMPWHDAGVGALGQIVPGVSPGGQFDRRFTMADFAKDPGYDFRMNQGREALEGGAAARGGLLTGGTLKALSRYGQDYASNEYDKAYNRYNNDQTSRFNRLSTVAGIGQTASNTLATAGNTNTANQIAGLNAAGNAGSAASVAQGNAIGGAVTSLGNWYQQRQMMNGGGGVNTVGPGSSYNTDPSSYGAQNGSDVGWMP